MGLWAAPVPEAGVAMLDAATRRSVAALRAWMLGMDPGSARAAAAAAAREGLGRLLPDAPGCSLRRSWLERPVGALATHRPLQLLSARRGTSLAEPAAEGLADRLRTSRGEAGGDAAAPPVSREPTLPLRTSLDGRRSIPRRPSPSKGTAGAAAAAVALIKLSTSGEQQLVRLGSS